MKWRLSIYIVTVAVFGWLLIRENRIEKIPVKTSTTPIVEQSSFSISVPSLYNDKIGVTQAKPVFISEVQFLLDSLHIVKRNGWLGQPGVPLLLRVQDYDSQQVGKYILREKDRTIGLTIPDTLLSLYTTPAAQQEMLALIRQVRKEYLAYAQEKGVAGVYLAEIETNTLPDDLSRIHYYPAIHYPDVKVTSTHTYDRSPQNDYSKLQIDVVASTIYKSALEFQHSGILGQIPDDSTQQQNFYKQCRDLSLRYAIYHEMTHVLQHAVDVVNAAPEYKKSMIPWYYSQRKILFIDSSHYQTWGTLTDPLTRDINNLTIAKESQAEGISIQMLGDIYHLSESQRTLVWEYHFGVLREATQAINEFFSLGQQWYPQYNLEYFAHRLRMDVVDTIPAKLSKDVLVTFVSMQSRLDGEVAANVGYLNPMLPEEVHRFWDYIKQ